VWLPHKGFPAWLRPFTSNVGNRERFVVDLCRRCSERHRRTLKLFELSFHIHIPAWHARVGAVAARKDAGSCQRSRRLWCAESPRHSRRTSGPSVGVDSANESGSLIRPALQ
jgi:hypothetical protein